MDNISSAISNNHVRVRVKPNARKTMMTKIEQGILFLDIRAPPEDGKANAEVERYLTKLLGRKAVIKTGFASKEKLVALK
jgi:uncharacterized protein (TIGR00251 family)